ncbi:hypothetical protein GCM10010247_43290 [Streptomyces calvus]|nr:hypothetical protein GCM10010247_43290 [Streptomyces calvus]
MGLGLGLRPAVPAASSEPPVRSAEDAAVAPSEVPSPSDVAQIPSATPDAATRAPAATAAISIRRRLTVRAAERRPCCVCCLCRLTPPTYDPFG